MTMRDTATQQRPKTIRLMPAYDTATQRRSKYRNEMRAYNTEEIHNFFSWSGESLATLRYVRKALDTSRKAIVFYDDKGRPFSMTFMRKWQGL